MRTLSQRERKLLALFILCIVASLIWVVIVGPVISGFSERSARRSLLTQQYQANQRMIGSIPRLRRQVERQREDLRNFVITAPTQAAAGVILQERLQRTIENAGGEVRAIEDASGADGQARAHGSARMTLAQLTAMLARLQNEPPYLVVEALNIAADQAVLSGRPETMEVGLEISGPVILSKSR